MKMLATHGEAAWFMSLSCSPVPPNQRYHTNYSHRLPTPEIQLGQETFFLFSTSFQRNPHKHTDILTALNERLISFWLGPSHIHVGETFEAFLM